MRAPTPISQHELRDRDGRLVAVLDVIAGDGDHDMIELGADVHGSSYRLRIFSRRAAEDIERARAA